MINLPLYKISEKPPKHEQNICLFKGTISFGFASVEPIYTTVSYHWAEYDEDGDYTGSSICYNGETEMQGCKLEILNGSGFTLDDDDYYIDVNEMYNLLLGEES